MCLKNKIRNKIQAIKYTSYIDFNEYEVI